MSDDTTDNSLLLDEEDELYGYGVYNVHENCFVDIPDVDRGITTEDHLTQEEMTLLNHVARDHQLDSTDHFESFVSTWTTNWTNSAHST